MNYTAGLAGILVPFSALAMIQRENAAFSPLVCAVAFWLIAIISGIAVAGCYLYDDRQSKSIRISEAEERESLYRQQLNHN